jgi:protein gp37
MGKTKIEWTSMTLNPIVAYNLKTGKRGWFCTHSSEGCRSCYSERINKRLGTGIAFSASNESKIELRWLPEVMARVLQWKKPCKVFPFDMTDLFHPLVPDEWIDEAFAYMALAQQHTFQCLSKRAERMAVYFASRSLDRVAALLYSRKVSDASQSHIRNLLPQDVAAHLAWPLPNAWLGFSAEDQGTFDQRWQHMRPLAEAGWLVWASLEPLLGRIVLSDDYLRLARWTVTGSESGPQARPMDERWVRSIRDQCVPAGIPLFYKQRIANGKKVSTPELDGQIWTEFPKGGEVRSRVGVLPGRLF